MTTKNKNLKILGVVYVADSEVWLGLYVVIAISNS